MNTMADIHRLPCCGLDSLVETLGGNRALAQKLARMFLDSHEATLAKLDQTVQAADLDALRRLSHDIRGTCAVFAAERCLKLARKIEIDLSDQQHGDWLADSRALRQALEDMAAELQQFVGAVQAG